MPTSRRPRLASYAAGLVIAALAASGLSTAAQADDHPPIFNFNAHRTSGSLVEYSGRYALWNDATQAYERPARSSGLSLDQYIPAYQKVQGSPWDGVLDVVAANDGSFGGKLRVYPATTLRVSAGGDASASVALPYYSPMPVSLILNHAYQTKAKKPVTVRAQVSPNCIIIPANFNSEISCPLTQKVRLQSKIKSKWKTVGTFKLPAIDDGGLPDLTIKNPKGNVYRLYLPGNSKYKKTYSKAFKPTKPFPAP